MLRIDYVRVSVESIKTNHEAFLVLHMKNGGGLDQSRYIMEKDKNIFIHRLEYRIWKKRAVKGDSKVFA